MLEKGKDRKDKGKGFYRRHLTKFPSLKLQESIICRTSLVRDYAFLLEHDRNASYRKNPFKIRYFLDGKYRKYTPDFLVITPTQKLIVKVTPADKVPQWQTIFKIVSQICRREGYVFVVVTEREIRVQPKIDNIKRLYRYARIPLPIQLQFHCRNFFEGREHAPVRDLAAFLKHEHVEQPLATTYGLIYHGFLEIELMVQLNLDSAVWLPSESPDRKE